jgi:hypothetical protein
MPPELMPLALVMALGLGGIFLTEVDETDSYSRWILDVI